MPVGFRLVFFETAGGNSPVENSLGNLDPKGRAYIAARLDVLQEHGLRLGTEHVRLITGYSPLREFRLSHNRREFRLLFFPAGSQLVAVHFFQKKGARAERKELRLGWQRMKAWQKGDA